MAPLKVLFINCTHKLSPELSNTDALWNCAAEQYRQKGCQVQQVRSIDLLCPAERMPKAGEIPPLLEQVQATDILIVGRSGPRSSVYQRLLEHLQDICQTHAEPATGQTPLYGKVFGVVGGDRHNIAQTCYEFSQLGCVNPPNNTVTWQPSMGEGEDFMAASGQQLVPVHLASRLLVEDSVAIATLLQQSPLNANLREAIREAQADQVTPASPTLLTPQALRTAENPDGLAPHHLTKRIWTMMQEGMRRGFTFKVLSLEDRIFQAERDGEGFIYKIYPGHFSFRRQYSDYDYEQSKSRKLALMQQDGLSVPVSYGTFQTLAEIPLETLSYPLVAKPDSGSLSQNVFPNLRTAAQLRQAAAIIEASGGVIKLESHITGRDYRVLIINHQYAGCVERRPANVTGDGKRTILELFQARNQEAGRGDRNEAHTTLHQLVFDGTSRQLLHSANYTLDTVLPVGKMFFLQEKITAATGADYVDCTDLLHPTIIKDCIAFSHRFSTLTLGFDLITTDPSRPLAETNGAFNEYNFLPYVDLHENCNIGQQRPVCRLIWDYIEAHAAQILSADFKVF